MAGSLQAEDANSINVIDYYMFTELSWIQDNRQKERAFRINQYNRVSVKVKNQVGLAERQESCFKFKAGSSPDHCNVISNKDVNKAKSGGKRRVDG